MDFTQALGEMVVNLGAVRKPHWSDGDCLFFAECAIDDTGEIFKRSYPVGDGEPKIYRTKPFIVRITGNGREIWQWNEDDIRSDWERTALPFQKEV